MPIRPIFLFALLLFSAKSFSMEATDNPKHSVFLGIGVGDSEVNAPDELPSDYNTKLANQFGYRYQYSDFLSVAAQYINSNSTELSSVADGRDLNLDFQGLALSAQFRLSLTDRAFLFGQLGSNSYEWRYDGFRVIQGDILVDDRKKISGKSLIYSAGFKFEFTRFDITAEHQWLDMGELEVDLSSIAVGYRF